MTTLQPSPGSGTGSESEQGSGVVYTLGSNVAERARLRRQSGDLRAHAEKLCDLAHIGPGQRVLDLGCGPSGILDVLSERVGPTGEVVGLDANPKHVALAQEFAAAEGLGNVTVMEGDARGTGLAENSFDVVHARLVLVNIPDPVWVVAEMARLVKPGGYVLSQEADALLVCEPPHPAVKRLHDVLLRCYAAVGADIHIGRRVPSMYRALGLVDAGVDAVVDIQPAGHPRRPILLDLLRSMKDTAVGSGFIGSGEYDALDRVARAHLNDPAVVVAPTLYFLCAGRKPPKLTRPPL